jgi:hypothetical protein
METNWNIERVFSRKRTLAIVGGRDFEDFVLLSSMIDEYFGSSDQTGENEVLMFYRFDKIVSGGARGTDTLAKKFAEEIGCPLEEFLPDWDGLGKRAGFVRNEKIIGAADVVLAFWDGKSSGTGSSLGIAKRLKKDTIIVYY